MKKISLTVRRGSESGIVTGCEECAKLSATIDELLHREFDAARIIGDQAEEMRRLNAELCELRDRIAVEAGTV